MSRDLLAAVLVAASAAITAPCLAQSNETKAAPSRPTLDQFMRIRTPGSASLLPDGTMLVRDWPDGIWQLYRVAPSKTGSFKPGEGVFTKLTTFTDGLSGYSLSPDGSRIVLLHAAGGNENTQLSFLSPTAAAGTAPTPILANPKVQSALNHWSPDGRSFYYSANDESPSDFYLYRWDFSGPGGAGKATRILAKPGSWTVADVSNDGSRALVSQFNSASHTVCYELTIATGDLKDITIKPADSTAACDVVGYMPGDETKVLLTSDIEQGKVKLFLKDLSTGEFSQPIPSLGTFELDGAGFNTEKTLLAAVSNEDGYGVSHLYSIPGFKPLPMPEMEKGVVGGGQFNGRTMVWSLNNARKPGLSYVTTWAEGSNEPKTRQLTFTQDQGVNLDAFPLPELVTYSAFDGTPIPAFLFTPPGHKKGTAIPFVVNYHGGPEGQHRPVFSATIQYLLSEGFGVMMPNVRGSVGYGRAFHMMDDYKKRWDSVRDGVDGAEWLVANGYAAPGKIATYGGSYGGFMSVACLVEDQQRVDDGKRKERLFGAGVNVVGIVNLKTFLEKTSGYRRKLREAEYGPLSDPEFLASVSSINKLDKLNVPMFIAHGYNDPRVPVEEAMQVAIALKDKGVPTQLFIAPDEGHGFAKLDNRMLFNSRMADFLRSTIAK